MKATEQEGIQLATAPETDEKGISRRKFLTLAGIGAVVGAVVVMATRQKGVQGLLKSVSGTQVNQATQGKVIRTAAPPAAPSILQKILGGKL